MTITIQLFTPRMGTGYSASFSSPLTSSVMSSSFPLSVPAAVAALVASNSTPASQPASIYGYNGPTIPELRSEPQVNAMASHYLSSIQCEILALVTPSYQHSSLLGSASSRRAEHLCLHPGLDPQHLLAATPNTPHAHCPHKLSLGNYGPGRQD